MLCGEGIAYHAEAEQALIKTYLDAFTTNQIHGDPLEYFYTYGVLQICLRIAQYIRNVPRDILLGKTEESLHEDSVFAIVVQELLLRGSEWASRSEHLNPLTLWFDKIATLLNFTQQQDDTI